MRPLLRQLQPTNGIAHFLHVGLVLVLPVTLFVLARLNFDFIQLAPSIIVLSKWRMFAVRPRFWASNIRANAIDIMVGIAVVVFMNNTDSMSIQLMWATIYAGWLLLLKPATGSTIVALQAGIGQLAALSALYLTWADGPIYGLTLLSGLFCFLAARHFLDTFDEPYARMLSYTWGYFGAALAWVLGHWLLFYHGVAQPTLLLSALGYGLAVLYYLDHNERLSANVRRQFVVVMIAIVIVVLAFSDWGDKVV